MLLIGLIGLIAAVAISVTVAVLVAITATPGGLVPRTMDPAASWRQGS